MRWYRHPLATLGLCWLLVSGLFIFAMCTLPGPRPATLTEAPTPTRLPMIVQPTVFVFSSPSPEPPMILEALPMATSTPQPSPTGTRVPEPTATPTPRPPQTPVQRG